MEHQITAEILNVLNCSTLFILIVLYWQTCFDMVQASESKNF